MQGLILSSAGATRIRTVFPEYAGIDPVIASCIGGVLECSLSMQGLIFLRTIQQGVHKVFPEYAGIDLLGLMLMNLKACVP